MLVPCIRYSDSDNELDRGFFERNSTTQYIDLLAAQPAVTIIAGAGVSADLGAPLWGDLMESLLVALIEDSFFTSCTREEKEARSSQLVGWLSQSHSPAYLASIVRTLITDKHKHGNPEAELRKLIAKVTESGRTSGGFLARSIATLALSIKSRGGHVRIITTNYGDEIEGEQAHVHQTDTELKPYTLRGYSGVPPPSDAVPVIHLNGRLATNNPPLVVGEVEFFARYSTSGRLLKGHTWRTRVIDQALRDSVTIFVGSSLTDPDMLNHLARSLHYDNPRFAVLIRPDYDVTPAPSRSAAIGGHRYATSGAPGEAGILDEISRRKADFLIGERYEHLRVASIQTDFRHQVPQLLREIALKTRRQEQYSSYMDRLTHWWRYWEAFFGEGTKDRDREVLGAHHNELCRVKEVATSYLMKVAKKNYPVDEELAIEVWIRNPLNRTLFLWCSSEYQWYNSATIYRAPITAPELYVAQTTFTYGRIISSDMRPKRGPWRYYVSSPLVLYEDPWDHLPIGVMNCLSTKPSVDGGALAAVSKVVSSLNAFDHEVKGIVNEMLDPIDRPCRQKR